MGGGEEAVDEAAAAAATAAVVAAAAAAIAAAVVLLILGGRMSGRRTEESSESLRKSINSLLLTAEALELCRALENDGALNGTVLDDTLGSTFDGSFVDLNGDGVPDFIIHDSIAVTFPIEDSAPYQDWFNASALGLGDLKNLTIEYQDDNHVPVLTLTVPVAIESLGYSDIFLGTGATPGRDVQVRLKPKGIIICTPVN